jgi:hypothetical protein
MTATACPQEVIPERVTVGLWARRSHLPERERVLAFCNDLVMALRNGQMPDVPRTSLGELELSTMTINALRRSGFFYLDEVELLSAEQLCSIHRIGAFSAAEILQATTFEVFPALEPPAPEALQDQARSLIQAFYICTEDQERMAALLLRAADLASGGPAHLRNLAMALLEQPA